MNTVVRTKYGTVRGYERDGIVRFHAIPYAKKPEGSLRFLPPESPDPWEETLDATKRGFVPPQETSDLDRPMGPVTLPFSEDCLTVAVYAPSEGEHHPVAVWFHGGANCYCGGDLPWYDGASLAKASDCVIVNIGFRLGILGFLCVENLIEEPVSILDQILALRWVQENIDAFGGDPKKVTVFGQSAGGNAIAHILSRDDTEGLFSQVILESASLGRGNHLRADAFEVGRAILKNLKINENGDDILSQLQSRTTDELLQAAAMIPEELKKKHQGMYFKPVRDEWHTPEQTAEKAALAAAERKIRVITGFTREETWAFCEDRDADTIAALARGQHLRYDIPGRQFAQLASDRGCDVWKYEFDWSAPDSIYGACHCLELPFVFGNLDSWDAPFLKGADMASMERLKETMQRCWGAFFRGEDPDGDRWPRYNREFRQIRFFDNLSNRSGTEPEYEV